jgi:hypothetical protein
MRESELPNLRERDSEALGKLMSVHPAASGIHKVNIVIASIFTLLPGIGAVAFLISHLTGKPGNQNWIGAAICGVIALFPGILLFVLLLKLRWKLFLFENGLVQARTGNRVILWTEVKSMFEEQDVVAGIRADARIKFTLLSGSWAIIDSSYKNFPDFAAGVRAGVTRAVLARVSTAIKRGEEVSFGKLKVSRSGLTYEDEALKWGEVGEVVVESDGMFHSIRVYSKGKIALAKGRGQPWFSRSVTDFPNLEAFLELARKVTTVSMPVLSTAPKVKPRHSAAEE